MLYCTCVQGVERKCEDTFVRYEVCLTTAILLKPIKRCTVHAVHEFEIFIICIAARCTKDRRIHILFCASFNEFVVKRRNYKATHIILIRSNGAPPLHSLRYLSQSMFGRKSSCNKRSISGSSSHL